MKEEIKLPLGVLQEEDKVNFPKTDFSDFYLVNYLQSASSDLSSVVNHFENLPSSHIERKETKELYEWIIKPLNEKEDNIAILAGNAGMGKSVIMRDLQSLLTEHGIPVLGLKSDRRELNASQFLGRDILGVDVDIKSVFSQLSESNDIVVLLIDQIDALSQSLSTNRKQLYVYLNLINTISQIRKVRIVVSCRIFDLKNEAEFKQFRNKKEIILSPLSEQEVEKVLIELTGKGLSHFPKKLIDLLKTPLNLDVFCRIYSANMNLVGIRTLHDLYRNLWEQKIKNYKDSHKLEKTTFKIANEISKRNENLCVPISLFSINNHNEILFLKSEGLIVERQNFIQFFHQSFYDYVYARFFVEKKGGIVVDFLNEVKHQGLFIRSKIKQIFSYLREYNPDLYIEQLKKVLFADNVRYHIKLMLIEMLAFEEQPSSREFNLILQVGNYNKNLYASFFFSIPKIKWLYFLDKKGKLTDIINEEKNQLSEAVKRFIVFSAKIDAETSLKLLSNITDEKERGEYLRWALYNTNDFSNQFVLQTYYSICDELINHKNEDYHILLNAINSNLNFVLKEARRLFYKELPEWKKERRKSLGHAHRAFHFYEELYKNSKSKETYLFFKEIVKGLSDKADEYSYYPDYKLLKANFLFTQYDPDSYEEHKYIDWLVEWLNKNINSEQDFVISEVDIYFKSNDVLFMFIALRVIRSNISVFLHKIFSLLTNSVLTEDCLMNDDLQYLYRDILEKSYSLFSQKEQLHINQFILSFYSDRDKHTNKEYVERRKKYPAYRDNNGVFQNKHYPYYLFTYSQFLLLNSIPLDFILKYKELKIRLGEVNRRFDELDRKNVQPHRGLSMASYVGGLVSPAVYEKFSLKHWQNSFFKYDTDRTYFDGRRPVDASTHATAFRDVVKKNPTKFLSLIKEILNDEKIFFGYKVEAIYGLTEAKFDIVVTRQLFGSLLNQDIPDTYFYSVIRCSLYFIYEEHIDEELISFWDKCVNLPFDPNERRIVYSSLEGKKTNDILFNEGWNTKNAGGLMAIVDLLLIDSYREYAIKYLKSVHGRLPIQLKLVVLYKLNSICNNIPQQLLFELFQLYTKETTSEIFHVAGQIISNIFHDYFIELIPFVKATINMPMAVEHLSIYLLYGWFYGYEESKELLFELHKLQPESIQYTLRESFRYYKNKKIKEKCNYIIYYYVTDTNKNIRETYSNGFYKLPKSDFPLLKSLIIEYLNYLNEDRLHGLYSYLMKCSKDYPKECLEIQKLITKRDGIKEAYLMSDPIKLILLSYNSIREYESQKEYIEFAMDVFDELLERNRVGSELDKFLQELDK